LFIIPVRLEECKPPSRLSKWHYADYFENQRERGIQRLFFSLKRRAHLLGLENEKEPITDLSGKLIADLIGKAIELVRVTQKANPYLLQSSLQISFTNAVRVLDQLEEMGVVGPAIDREVLAFGDYNDYDD